SFAIGPDRTRVSMLQAGADTGGFSGSVAAQRFTTDGYRAHSAAQRDQTFARLDMVFDGGHHLLLTGNLIHQPDTADPLGLSQAQFDADPRQAPVVATTFNTRKSINHQQLGAVYGGGNGAFTWKLIAYGGNRDVEQFLSTPISAQIAAASAGGVVSLDRGFHGVSGRVTYEQAAWSASVGVEIDSASEVRRGYENFVTSGNAQTLGVRGRLRRDELNEQTSIDGYAYAEWAFADDWKAHTAIRNNRIVFKSTDHYITADNGDDSGERRYHKLTPAIALVRSLTPSTSIYVSASSGFETPTAAELAYRSDRASGLNFALAASTNRQIEMGYKARRSNAAINIAAFLVATESEIVPATSSGGRSTFQNAGRTLRRGVESSLDYQVPEMNLATRLTYTGLRATLRDGYRVLDTGGRTIAAGSLMPAIPEHQLFAEVSWRRGLSGINASLEAQARSRVWADDANTAAASGFGVLHARLAYRLKWGAVELQPFARLENILNRKYISSVIVNDANLRFFESAAARRWLAGVSGSVRF
ncbi:MAG: TonB-dependent receptor, partial [Betaproteobacteria bacterium]